MKLAKLAFWEYNIKEDAIYLPDQFGALLGETWDGIRTLTLEKYIQGYIFEEDQLKIIEAFKTAESKGFLAVETFVEYRLKRKDGIIINVFNIIQLRRDDFDNPVRCDGIIQDISALRKTEAELRDYHNNLHSLVAQKTDLLRRSQEKLNDALKLAKLTTWEFDFKSKKFYGGGAIQEILGLPAEVSPGPC